MPEIEIEEFDVTPEDLDSTRKCERGVYVYRVTEGEYIAAHAVEEAVAYHHKQFDSDISDLDFGAEAEDLDELVYDEEGGCKSFRDMIRSTQDGEIPFVAAMVEAGDGS